MYKLSHVGKTATENQFNSNFLCWQFQLATSPGLELPPGISPALVGCIPGSVVGKAVAAGDAVCPWLCH